MSQTEKEILRKAINKWGNSVQLSMVKEELAELIVAVSHWERERIKKDELASEIADVLIMINQLKLMVSVSDYQIDQHRSLKLARLKERLSD